MRKPKEIRREEILEAATRMLAKDGYESTSFQRIANRLKLTQAAILHHYRSKHDLVEACMERVAQHNFEMVSAGMRPELDALDRLKIHFERNIAWGIEHRHEAQILLLVQSLACTEPRFTEYYERVVERSRGRIAEYLLASIREGLIPRDTDVKLSSEIFQEAVMGGIYNFIATSGAESRKREILIKIEFLMGKILGIKAKKKR